MSSIDSPSRAERLSMTAMRHDGRFLRPKRLSRIATAKFRSPMRPPDSSAAAIPLASFLLPFALGAARGFAIRILLRGRGTALQLGEQIALRQRRRASARHGALSPAAAEHLAELREH